MVDGTINKQYLINPKENENRNFKRENRKVSQARKN
jgi:hypothetical protein